MQFLKTEPQDYQLIAMERQLAIAGFAPEPQPLPRLSRRAGDALWRMALLRRLLSAQQPLLVVGGNLPMREFVPYGYLRPLVLWRFDVWQPDYERWERYLRQTRTRLAFFTARQAVEELGRRVPRCECIWLPESVHPPEYLPGGPLAGRPIDVLELGRKYDKVHECLRPALERAGRVHLYERIKGRIIFPTKHALVEGMADAKVILCYPSSLTHPARSGNVETLTHRYLQTMVSGALVVGKAPAELIDLFGYNPVVELEDERAAEQLLAVLDRIGEYQPLIERNRRRVLEAATTEIRVAELTRHLAARGYDVPAVG